MIDWSLLRNSFTHAHATLNFWYANPLPKTPIKSIMEDTGASFSRTVVDAVPNFTLYTAGITSTSCTGPRQTLVCACRSTRACMRY
jgi:hypothetical protein